MQVILKHISLSILLVSPIIYAQPVVSNNVHVIRNATASQCTSSWEGTAATETDVTASGYGQNNVATPSIQSCTGCGIESRSHDCVCNKCYAYTN